MHEFKHPNYYKELRKRNREVLRSGRGLAVNQAPHVSDQVISPEAHDGERERAPGPGNKLDVPAPAGPSVKPQASSSKQQAPSIKLSNQPVQASSDKRQAPSSKRQA